MVFKPDAKDHDRLFSFLNHQKLIDEVRKQTELRIEQEKFLVSRLKSRPQILIWGMLHASKSEQPKILNSKFFYRLPKNESC